MIRVDFQQGMESMSQFKMTENYWLVYAAAINLIIVGYYSQSMS